MELTRREFMEGSLGAVSILGFSLFEPSGLAKLAEAAEPKTVAEIPVIWMATGACSGCSVSLLNSASPTIQELLLDEVLPGKHLSLGYHATIMAAAGVPAMKALDQVVENNQGGYVLVVDGATSMRDDGLYCIVGETDGHPITGYQQVARLGRGAMAVLSVGACAAFGGIPASGSNPTDSMSIAELFEREKITTPYVNIPGCPPHPDWIVGTIATLLLGGLEALKLDELHRPAPFFEKCIHDNCQFRGQFERGQFAEKFGEHGCLLKLGCKGPITDADCPVRKFNGGTSWCCEAGHPCIGCCHPDFPFSESLFSPVEPAELDFPALYSAAEIPQDLNTSTYVAVGLIGFGGFLAGAGATAAALRLRSAMLDAETAAEAVRQKEQTDGDD